MQTAQWTFRLTNPNQFQLWYICIPYEFMMTNYHGIFWLSRKEKRTYLAHRSIWCEEYWNCLILHSWSVFAQPKLCKQCLRCIYNYCRIQTKLVITVNFIFVENDMKYRNEMKELDQFVSQSSLSHWNNLFGTDNTMQFKIYGNYQKVEILEFLDLNANFFIKTERKITLKWMLPRKVFV